MEVGPHAVTVAPGGLKCEPMNEFEDVDVINPLTKEGTMRNHVVRIVLALSLLLGGMAHLSPGAQAAPWISGADSTWVKDIEKELNKKDYRPLFLNDPRTPQASVLSLLGRAATAAEAGNDALAQDLVHRAIDVLEDGVRRHYYEQSDIDPLLSYIKQHAPIKKRSA